MNIAIDTIFNSDCSISSWRKKHGGKISSREITAACIDRIGQWNQVLNCFITVTPELAIAAANRADKCIKAGAHNAVTGTPIAHKDIFCTKGVLTTCASKILANFVSPYDATVVELADKAGLVSLGKTNMDEFAIGSSNETSYFGAVRNPWDLSRVPGGSSGGSAAAVAAGLVFAATASDTGGSIRQPAAFCGVTGFKPSYGTVSRYGMIAYASSLDQAGIIARSVADAAVLTDSFAGPDRRDSTSSKQPWTKVGDKISGSIDGFKIGIPWAFIRDLDASCQQSFATTLAVLEAQGAKLVTVDLPHASYGVAAYYVIACAEASANLARYDGVRYGYRCEAPQDLDDLYTRSRTIGFGSEVKRRILTGIYTLSTGYYDAYYERAQQIRSLISQDFTTAFASVDAIATPTTPTPAFALGEHLDNPVSMYQQDVYTVLANMAGLPALSVPAEPVAGLPYGLQLQAERGTEARLLRIGHAIQCHSDWHRARPDLSALLEARKSSNKTAGEA